MIHNLSLYRVVLSALMLGVAACASAQTTPPAATRTLGAVTLRPTALSTATGEPDVRPTAAPTSAAVGQATLPPQSESALTRLDTQGAVEFAVTPLNLTTPSETLDFEVSLNTHSVDLAWDLAAQSALATDTGLAVKGLSWPVGGGHHYEGTLTFLAKTAEGKPLLVGATKLTLTIQDAGAPSRVFEWALSK